MYFHFLSVIVSHIKVHILLLNNYGITLFFAQLAL